MSTLKNSSGFTLVELSIAAGLLGMMAMGASQVIVGLAHSRVAQTAIQSRDQSFLDLNRFASFAYELPTVLNQSKWGPASTSINPCFKTCLSGASSLSADSCKSGTNQCVPKAGVGYDLTLYSRVGKVVAGPDPGNGNLPIRYSRTGRVCGAGDSPSECPIIVKAFFNPSCPGLTTSCRQAVGVTLSTQMQWDKSVVPRVTDQLVAVLPPLTMQFPVSTATIAGTAAVAPSFPLEIGKSGIAIADGNIAGYYPGSYVGTFALFDGNGSTHLVGSTSDFLGGAQDGSLGTADIFHLTVNNSAKVSSLRQHGAGSGSTQEIHFSKATANGSWVAGAVTNGMVASSVIGAHGIRDLFVTKYDTEGKPTASFQFGDGVNGLCWSWYDFQKYWEHFSVDSNGNLLGAITLGYYACGSNAQAVVPPIGTHGLGDILIFKIGSDGTMKWIKEIGLSGPSSGNTALSDMVSDSNGSMYFSGYCIYCSYPNPTQVFGPPSNGVRYIAKVDSDGNLVWSDLFNNNFFTSNNAPGVEHLALDNTGQLLAAGTTYAMYIGTKQGQPQAGAGQQDPSYMKIDAATGNVIWATELQIGAAATFTESAFMASGSTGNIYIGSVNEGDINAGSTHYGSGANFNTTSPGLYGNLFLAQLDSATGAMIWSKQWNANLVVSYGSYDRFALIDANDNLYVSGMVGTGLTATQIGPTSLRCSHPSMWQYQIFLDSYVLKVDKTGAPVWLDEFGAGPGVGNVSGCSGSVYSGVEFHGFSQDGSGGLLAHGLTNYSQFAPAAMTGTNGDIDSIAVKLNDSNGSLIWAHELGAGPANQVVGSVQLNPIDKLLYWVGTTTGVLPAFPIVAHGTSDAFVARLNPANGVSQ